MVSDFLDLSLERLFYTNELDFNNWKLSNGRYPALPGFMH